MDPLTILGIINAALEIRQRHFAATGEELTAAQVQALLLAELQDGDSTAARWFISKGLPVPR